MIYHQIETTQVQVMILPSNNLRLEISLWKKLDKNSNYCNYRALKGVQFGKNNTFNVFAVNKMLDKSWEERDTSKENWILTTDGFIRKFNIRIATPTGCICLNRLVQKKQ